MSGPLQLRHEAGAHVDVLRPDGGLLWRYVYAPTTPANEARRPYAHPVCSFAGDVLTNFRPNDHPWHHALSLTLTSVDGVNFWGGPSYRSGEGYRWRDDAGEQRHEAWLTVQPGRLEERIGWVSPSGERLIEEHRRMETELSGAGWELRWTSELRNVTRRELVLGNYHATHGLVGSHYTGLQFRGARDLLDEHGDATIGISAEGERRGEGAVHGVEARWMEWSCQHDTSLRRTRIRFENLDGPLPWFVRAKNPVAAFAFHRDVSQPLASGSVLPLRHQLSFAPG